MLIPQPASMQAGDGSFTVAADTQVIVDGPQALHVAERLNGFLVEARHKPLPIVIAGNDDGPRSRHAIQLSLAASGKGVAEGYALDIDADSVRIVGNDEAGLFYGATTLWQLLTESDGASVTLPALHIEDAPRFRWRGYMLDSARQFQSVDQIKQVLDAMALHKLNTFHWHLTDDQGWRIEIKKYPKLAEVGGCRDDIGTHEHVCGWYSQDDIRDVVAYAAARHITIVPEIDLPGHATAMIAAYPKLGNGDRSLSLPLLGVSIDAPTVTNGRGIYPNLLNVDDSTFKFLDNVFKEVADLFPGPYVHVGGDEALKDQWKASPRVQEKLHKLGLKDETALQGWFVAQLQTLLDKRGKRLLGWDEISDGDLPQSATVMSWRGLDGGIKAAQQGHDVVMSPSSDVYFDYLQTDSINEYPGRPAPKLLPLQKVYAFEPVPDALNAAQQKHVLGLQANLWTTDNRLFAGVEHNTFPRLLAVAETGWTPRGEKSYASFLQRLPAWMHRYDLLGIAYARTPFEVIADASPVPRTRNNVNVALRNPLDFPIHYTLDGSAPSLASPLYAQALQLKLPQSLRAAAFVGDTPLLPAQAFDISLDALRTRRNDELQQCSTRGPVLRIEDDGPEDGPLRAMFDVNIMEPCWQWDGAPLDGIDAIDVHAARLPWTINQSAAEDVARKYLPAQTQFGELDIRLGSCDGPQLVALPLPQDADANGFVALHADLPRQLRGTGTMCIRFSGDYRPRTWVLDRITLLPKSDAH